MKRPLIILAGPTAAGKTDASILLAKAIDGEIISADSMQVYRHMDIGSAKISLEERGEIPHYLIDVLEPDEEFNVVRFQQMAKEAMETIYAKGKIPILTGGTGFYIQAVLKDIDFTETREDTACREKLMSLEKEKGSGFLYRLLKETDEKAAQEIHPNNTKRIIRALEFFYQTGDKISGHNEAERKKAPPYLFAYFVLTMDRQALYEAIERRVDKMMEKGLLEEVQNLKNMGYTRDMVSMQGLGYKELLDYLDGKTTLEEAVYILKRDTRHFAKRQLTWFRREPEAIWLDKDNYQTEADLITDMLFKLKDKGIIEK